MLRYTARRTIQALPLLLLVSVVSFAVMQLAPGGPLAAYRHNPRVTPTQFAAIRHDLGFDLPPYLQYLYWLGGILRGEWGFTLSTGEPVLTAISEHLGNTAVLVGAAFLVALALALPLGILAAVRPHSLFDYVFTFCSFIAWSAPVFWVAYLGQLIFAVKLRWLPAANLYTDGVPATLGDFLRHLVLPALILGLGCIASWSRYLRGALLATLGQDYIRTAAAKGVRASRVVRGHALRNALIPMVTVVALDVPTFFTGAVLVETAFSWPGMGRLFLAAVTARDYPLLQGLLLISAAIIFAANLLADLIYSALDPRVQLA